MQIGLLTCSTSIPFAAALCHELCPRPPSGRIVPSHFSGQVRPGFTPAGPVFAYLSSSKSSRARLPCPWRTARPVNRRQSSTVGSLPAIWFLIWPFLHLGSHENNHESKAQLLWVFIGEEPNILIQPFWWNFCSQRLAKFRASPWSPQTLILDLMFLPTRLAQTFSNLLPIEYPKSTAPSCQAGRGNSSLEPWTSMLVKFNRTLSSDRDHQYPVRLAHTTSRWFDAV